MSIKKIYSLSTMFLQERIAGKGTVQAKKDMDLIKEFLDFIWKHKNDV